MRLFIGWQLLKEATVLNIKGSGHMASRSIFHEKKQFNLVNPNKIISVNEGRRPAFIYFVWNVIAFPTCSVFRAKGPTSVCLPLFEPPYMTTSGPSYRAIESYSVRVSPIGNWSKFNFVLVATSTGSIRSRRLWQAWICYFPAINGK